MRNVSLLRMPIVEKLQNEIDIFTNKITSHPRQDIFKLITDCFHYSSLPHIITWRNIEIIPKPGGKRLEE